MLAFLRGSDTFTTVGEVYVKLLPNGEIVQLTRDATRKMYPVFSTEKREHCLFGSLGHLDSSRS
jgi:hypothetical protein